MLATGPNAHMSELDFLFFWVSIWMESKCFRELQTAGGRFLPRATELWRIDIQLSESKPIDWGSMVAGAVGTATQQSTCRSTVTELSLPLWGVLWGQQSSHIPPTGWCLYLLQWNRILYWRENWLHNCTCCFSRYNCNPFNSSVEVYILIVLCVFIEWWNHQHKTNFRHFITP